FMMDFIWGTPARLRGSRFTRYGARNLLSAKTLVDDRDTHDVLNHWAVYDHLIWNVDGLDLTCDRIHTIQAEHVHGRHPPQVMNGYREESMYIPCSQYSPLCDERALSELMDMLIDKARAIEHPIESSFFLWLHLAYLQPFDTANHRTSRAAMNIPLLKAGHVPITFAHVHRADYQRAMWGFYEFGDASIATDLFTWAYMQSAQRYAGFHLEDILNPKLRRS
ncbi:Fic family protein, partial [Herbaspirillum chlorophenolicum]|uniref:Fic family protein n=1 Tax=Herbaspirillum chlorophenolicum TaxID=211589 RepID=UPI0018CE48A0